MTNKVSTNRIDFDKIQVDTPQPAPQTPLPQDPLSLYLAVLELLRKPNRHLSSAPTFTPRSLAESIQFYDDGTNRRIYAYVNGTWRYTTLT
jgi:hypothetical protein